MWIPEAKLRMGGFVPTSPEHLDFMRAKRGQLVAGYLVSGVLGLAVTVAAYALLLPGAMGLPDLLASAATGSGAAMAFIFVYSRFMNPRGVFRRLGW